MANEPHMLINFETSVLLKAVRTIIEVLHKRVNAKTALSLIHIIDLIYTKKIRNLLYVSNII